MMEGGSSRVTMMEADLKYPIVAHQKLALEGGRSSNTTGGTAEKGKAPWAPLASSARARKGVAQQGQQAPWLA